MGKWTKGKLLTYWCVHRWINLDLFKKYQEPQTNGCINWTGVKNNIGYGFVGFNYPEGQTSPSGHKGGMMTAHRLAFMIHHDRMPTKRNVNHTCHNKLCVNPAHLTEGTQQEKMTAMHLAGIKGGTKKGTRRGQYLHKQTQRTYKYSEEEIQWVRTASSEDIAQRYNIDSVRASGMRYAFRTNYKWLPCPPDMVKLKPGRVKQQ